MALVDDRGRLFGRFNVFDAIVAVLVLWLIPLAYGAYWLLRAPAPELTAVVPSTIVHDREMRVQVRGKNFAPYLRVWFGRHQGTTFRFNDTTDAIVDFGGLGPGTYDVILYDNSQERDRIPNGLTILPSALPQAKLVAVGVFGNLSDEEAATLKPGSTIGGIGVIEQVGTLKPQLQRVFVRPNNVEIPIEKSRMLPAVLRLSCFIRSSQGQPECVADHSVQPASLFFFEMFGRQVPFQIEQVRAVYPLTTVTATVRFTGDPKVLSQIKVGDQDFGEMRNELSATARVESISAPGGAAREARLTVQAQRGAEGWLYDNAPLRPGSAFEMRNDRYEAAGTVITVEAAVKDPQE